MTTLILANSDAKALSSLADGLREKRPDWRILDMSSGEDVLAFVADNNVDCVISEVALQDMRGIDLLSDVKELNVDLIRIVMVPDMDEGVVLESAQANHRLICPTTTHDGVISAIETSMQLNERLNSDELKLCISTIHALPSLPIVYEEMVSELASPQSSLMNVARIIETDMGLTATVLKTVNSAYYGLNQRIESVPQGVALLGAHLIKNITLTAKVFTQFEGDQQQLQKLHQLNDQANKTGALANHFARLARLPKSVVDHAQIAGMLGNCGQLLAMSRSDKHDSTDQTSTKDELLCAYMLRLWLMPDPVVEAVALQSQPPPEFQTVISPWLVLHTIRFLDEHLPDVNNKDRWQECCEYLENLMDKDLAIRWLEAYSDLQQLTSHNDLDQTNAA